ncbi:MAG: hypothetical protein IJS32_08245 [Kiritimatiellae bacterium]|nr:hypothetical protein [Kiritimatiellia bacterium]
MTGNDQICLKALKHLERRAAGAKGEMAAANAKAEEAIADSLTLLERMGCPLPELPAAPAPESTEKREGRMRSWEEIAAEAEVAVGEEVSVADLLDEEEVAASNRVIEAIRKKYDLGHRLDGWDWGIAGIAGVASALIDIFLVQIPSGKGALGAAKHPGGWLSDKSKEMLEALSKKRGWDKLADKAHVPYDSAHSADLAQRVAGLGPRTHRFQSLGHDPVLGFVFGVKDILQGKFTAIDRFGKLVVQEIPDADTGMGVFGAIALQIRHLLSDVGTPGGLPAPFMPLLQFLQVGNINGHTIGELSRTMYANGYDFGHFLAMSVPVMVIEVLVRVAYFVKRMCEGHSFAESLPFDFPSRKRQPKLQTMLFTAHTIATAANAGKLLITKNPMGLNLAQWQWYGKVAYSQLHWVLFTKEAERLALVQESIDADWQTINDELSKGWTFVE